MVKKIVFLILIAVGIFFRVYAIEQIPGGLFGDEVSLAVNAKTIAQNGTDEYGKRFPFGFESFSDYKMPGYIYASVIPFDIFGPRILAIRFIAIISGIVSIFLIGYLAFLLFPKIKSVSWYAMVLLALSPFHIQFSRVAYETMFATTLLLGFFITYLKTIQSKNSAMWFLLSVVLLLSSCWTYPAPQFIIPFFLIAVLFVVNVFRPKDFPLKKGSLITTGFLLFTLISFIPEFLNPATTKRTLGYVFASGKNSSVLQFFYTKVVMLTSSWFRSFNLEFLFDKGDIFAYRSGTKLAGVFLPVFIPAFLTGVFICIKKFAKKEFSWYFLLLLFLICGLPSALTWTVPYGPRFLPMVIPLTILSALGVASCVDFLSKKPWRKFVYISFALILLYQIGFLSDIYFLRFPDLSEPEFVSAAEKLGTFLASVRRSYPQDAIYFLDGKSCASWRYEYLHFWYYANLPNKDMIAWDRKFRDMRFSTGNPFAAYDFLAYPTAEFDHVVLYPTSLEMAKSPKGSFLVHCGISLKDLNPKKEVIEKIFYLYDDRKSNPVYVVSQKL